MRLVGKGNVERMSYASGRQMSAAGRYAKKQFKKAQMPIVERLVDSLMMKGRNNGKKLMAVRIVAHAFEIIYLLSDQNPVQVSVNLVG